MQGGSPFVGRGADLERLESLFEAGDRLVTLWGPPGVGKTRLARRFAESERAGGRPVTFCDLRQTRSAGDVLDVVALALEVPRAGRDEAADRAAVGQAIAARGDATLVLDNYEQVAERAADLLEEWTQHAARARFVVTSRALVGVSMERPHEVAPLPEDDAIELFVERASNAGAPPHVLAEERATIGQVVRRLDRLPLAIELAAARCCLLPPRELVAALGRTAGSLAGLERALGWSWSLLTAFERTALCQLSVFRGDFTLESATAVIVLEGEGAPEVVTVLEALRRQSLLQLREPGHGGAPRYGLLVCIHAFAARRLSERPRDAAPAVDRHARHLLECCGGWAERMFHPADLGALDRLSDERDDLLAVVERLTAAGPGSPLLLGRAIRIVTPLLVFQGMTATARSVLESVLQMRLDPLDEAWCRLQLGHALIKLVRIDEGFAALGEAARIARELGATGIEALAVARRAEAMQSRGSEERAEQELQEARCLAYAAGDAESQLATAAVLADIRLYQGRIDEARDLIDSMKAAVRARPNWVHEAMIHFRQGWLRIAERRHMDALEDLREAEALFRRARHGGMVANLQGFVATVHQERGDLEAARACLEEGRRLFERMGLDVRVAVEDVYLGLLLHEAGELGAATARLRRGLRALPGTGAWFEEAIGWAGLGGAMAALDRPESAEEAFGEAERLVLRDLNPTARIFLFLQRGHLELALSRREDAAGEPRRAHALRAEARRRIALVREATDRDARGRLATREVRFALRVLAAALPTEAASPRVAVESIDAVKIGAQGQWVQLPGGPPAMFPKGVALRTIVLRLALHRLEAPGEAYPILALIEAAWPREPAGTEAARNRLRVTLHRLRKGPLGPLLVKTADGLLLEPTVPVVIVGP